MVRVPGVSPSPPNFNPPAAATSPGERRGRAVAAPASGGGTGRRGRRGAGGGAGPGGGCRPARSGLAAARAERSGLARRGCRYTRPLLSAPASGMLAGLPPPAPPGGGRALPCPAPPGGGPRASPPAPLPPPASCLYSRRSWVFLNLCLRGKMVVWWLSGRLRGRWGRRGVCVFALFPCVQT